MAKTTLCRFIKSKTQEMGLVNRKLREGISKLNSEVDPLQVNVLYFGTALARR